MLLMRFFFFLAVLGLVLVLLPDFLPLAFAQSANDPVAGPMEKVTALIDSFQSWTNGILVAVFILGAVAHIKGWRSILGWRPTLGFGSTLSLGPTFMWGAGLMAFVLNLICILLLRAITGS